MFFSYKSTSACFYVGHKIVNRMGGFLALIISLLSSLPLHASNFDNDSFFMLSQYLEHIQKTSNAEDLIKELSMLKNCLEKEGYHSPNLTDLALYGKTFIEGYGISFTEEQFQSVFSMIFEAEHGLIQFQNSKLTPYIQLIKRKGHIDDENLTDGFAIGFCKFLAGALCMIIPNTWVRTVGAGLIATGIDDMMKNEENPKFPPKMRKISFAC